MFDRNRKMIYEAVSLADRFPELPEQDVLEHIAEIFNIKYINANSVLGHAILIAYNTQNEHRGLDYLGIGKEGRNGSFRIT